MSSGLKDAVREAALWLIVASTVFFTVFYYEEISAFIKSEDFSSVTTFEPAIAQPADTTEDENGFERVVTLRSKRNGHFFTNAHINQKSIPVVVDTGATLVALSYEHAERAGIHLTDQDFKYRSRTANGISRVARITLDQVRIGDITVRNVLASVSEPGKMDITLLGMSFLSKIKNISLADGELVLTN